MKSILMPLACALALCLTPVRAQSTPPDPAAIAAANELMDALRIRDVMKATNAEMLKVMPDIILRTASDAIEGNRAIKPADRPLAIQRVQTEIPKLVAAISAVMNDPVLVDQVLAEVAPLYARHFTADEINQLSAFHRTPVGAKMLTVMPQLMRESIEISQRIMMPRMKATIDKTIAAIK